MSHNAITPQAIKAGAAVASLPLFASPAAASDGEKPKAEPVIGIATQGFDNDTNRSLAEELAGAGIHVVQLFLNQTDSRYWKYNGRSDVSRLTAQRSKAIADAYRSAGVSIHSIGVYTNLIHPDQAEREANLAYFDAMMQVGDAMGVHTFITEAGHYHSSSLPRRLSTTSKKRSGTRWSPASLAEIAERARRCSWSRFRGFLASAKRTRLFLEAVGSPRIRALLDPANLLEVNDLEEMFDQLGPRIDCLHAKDRKLHVDRGVPAGQGDLDYPKFVALAAKRTPSAPLILEYVGRDSYKQALAHLRGAIRSA